LTTRRVDRAQDLIKEEVSRLLLFRAKDQRLGQVNVTAVKMSKDLKKAVVYYNLLDNETDREEIARLLERATGFVRREIGKTVNLKFVPEIHFEFDRSIEYARHMEEVLKKISDVSPPEDHE
jgi:ribosome-binding factor A